MGKSIAIVQSNYIPWKGYFDLINMVDEFILYDDVQYTRRDWRNRNKVKTAHGLLWLTIPVKVKGKYYQRINEVQVEHMHWPRDHWRTITIAYAQATFFGKYRDIFENLYLNLDTDSLSQINFRFITTICSLLGISTAISWSTDYQGTGAKTERLISLCQQAQATHYVSGPSAQAYLDDTLLAKAGITLSYIDYADYPEYHQLFLPPFEHHVSVIDLIFNEGPQAAHYMKSFTNA